MNILVWLAGLYTLGYILFGYPLDTFFMRALHGLLTMIFSIFVLSTVLKLWTRRTAKQD